MRWSGRAAHKVNSKYVAGDQMKENFYVIIINIIIPSLVRLSSSPTPPNSHTHQKLTIYRNPHLHESRIIGGSFGADMVGFLAHNS